MEWKINDDAVNVVEIVGGVSDTKNRSSISKAFVSVDNLSKSFEFFLSFWFLQKIEFQKKNFSRRREERSEKD